MSDKRVKPLPCPFCGKAPQVFEGAYTDGRRYTDVDCLADCAANPTVTVEGARATYRAIRRWNRRTK